MDDGDTDFDEMTATVTGLSRCPVAVAALVSDR